MNLAWAYKNKIHLLGKALFLFSVWKAGLIIILVLCVSIFACNRKNLWDNEYLKDDTPIVLPDVTMTSATGGNTIITAEWIDPDISDLNRVEITCTDVAGTMEVLPGVQTYTITGLTNGNDYTVTIIVIDSSENTSAGISFTIAPSATPMEGHFIYTREDLNAVRGGVTGYDDWTLDDTYYLMADLDLSGYDPAGDGYGWVPIGWSLDMLTFSDFTGTFEGNNHTISNLTISRGSDQNIGLFRYNSGTIANLILANVNIAGGTNTGSIAGLNAGIIDSCQASGNLTGSWDCTGGIAGSNSGTITNSISSITVSGGYYTGGLVGANGSSCLIDRCSVSGNVTGTDDYVGGLIGENLGGITSSNATCDVTGNNNIGGLAGLSSGDGNINTYEISDSHFLGNVTGNGTTGTGGLVGYNSSGSSIEYSTAAGSVSGNGRTGGLVGNNSGCNFNQCSASVTVISNGQFTGGLIGYNLSSNITNSYATSSVSATSGTGDTGGLIGYNTGALTNCYATGAVSGTSNNIGGLIGRNNVAIITDSHASGTVTAHTNPVNNVGGLIGYNTGVIINCHKTGTSTVTGRGDLIGGLIGDNTASVSNSTASGNVTSTISAYYIGGLVGRSSGTVSNCSASGNITLNNTSFDYIGGLVGYTTAAAVISNNSRATGDVTVTATAVTSHVNIGGLIGVAEADISDSHAEGDVIVDIITSGSVFIQMHIGGLVGIASGLITISGSYAIGGTIESIVSGPSSTDDLYTGGLVGMITGATITDCHATHNVIATNLSGIEATATGGLVGNCTSGINYSYATGSVEGNTNTGGLVGQNSGGTITQSFATGAVTGSANVGGLIGYHNGTVTYCYARGDVSGTDLIYVGGLVGYHLGSVTTSLSVCYATDVVIPTSGGGLIGGLVTANMFEYSYYNEDNTGNSHGIGMSLTEMQDPGNYGASWDFTSGTPMWSVDTTLTINDGFPYLTDNAP